MWRTRLKNFDIFLFLSMILLIVFGLMVILSSNRQAFGRQFLFVLSGLTLYLSISLIDYRLLKKIAIPIFSFVLLLLIVLVVSGSATREVSRWLAIGGFRFQPSEFSKAALILLLACFLERRLSGALTLQGFVFSFLLTLLPVILVFLQPDLGTTVILLAIWSGLILVSGVKLRYLLGFALSSLLFFLPLWTILKEYQRQRIISFLNPSLDPLGSGYNVLQSMIAVGSGQFWGRGFGRGTQSHLKFLPEHYTDFIFASLAEEWGFVGVLALLILFAVLFLRILLIAKQSTDDLGFLISVGVFAAILAQFFINVGMNLGIMPVTGIPLPLISYGGSSIWVTMISLGLVQSVAVHRR